MPNYLNDEINQGIFLSINYLEVLGENTFEFCLYQLMSKEIDLSEFDAAYKNSRVGRKAYPPALLLRVIFYAYYRGITSNTPVIPAGINAVIPDTNYRKRDPRIAGSESVAEHKKNRTSNKGINKMSLRGKAKVTCQWTVCCIMHNIEKLWRYGPEAAARA